MRHVIALSSLLAALTFAAPQAIAQTAGNQGKFCLKGSESNAVTCAYDTMASCEQAKKGNAESCVQNTGNMGAAPTTGSAPMAPASTTGMSPASGQKNDPTATPTEPSKNVR